MFSPTTISGRARNYIAAIQALPEGCPTEALATLAAQTVNPTNGRPGLRGQVCSAYLAVCNFLMKTPDKLISPHDAAGTFINLTNAQFYHSHYSSRLVSLGTLSLSTSTADRIEAFFVAVGTARVRNEAPFNRILELAARPESDLGIGPLSRALWAAVILELPQVELLWEQCVKNGLFSGKQKDLEFLLQAHNGSHLVLSEFPHAEFEVEPFVPRSTKAERKLLEIFECVRRRAKTEGVDFSFHHNISICGFHPDFIVSVNDDLYAVELTGPVGHYLDTDTGQERAVGSDVLMERTLLKLEKLPLFKIGEADIWGAIDEVASDLWEVFKGAVVEDNTTGR